MKSKLSVLYDKLNASLWFIPSLMVIASVILMMITYQIDVNATDAQLKSLPGFNFASSEGARQLLAVLIGAMITVIGIVFSVTLVSLTVASTQYGPYILRTYMKDRTDQMSLGILIATFFYCLLTFRTIRETDGGSVFIPHVSVAVCLLLAIISVFVLVYFMHHMVAYIHVEKILKKLGEEFVAGVAHLCKEQKKKKDGDVDHNNLEKNKHESQIRIQSKQDGFIQTVDKDQLIEIAEKHDVIIYLGVRPGDFVFKNSVLAAVQNGVDCRETRNRIRESISIGSNRTVHQDILFSAEQIVEVALRALSPGMNEPFVANLCINYLGAGIARCADGPLPSPYYFCNEKLRVVAFQPVSFKSLLNSAFHQIRQNAANYPAVALHLLGTLGKIALRVKDHAAREALENHIECMYAASMKKLDQIPDRRQVEEEYRRAVEALGRTPDDLQKAS